MIPEIGEYYTAKEIKANNWSPCMHCKKNHLCNLNCQWNDWSKGGRESTLYSWNGTTAEHNKTYISDPMIKAKFNFTLKKGDPIYSDYTWERM